MAIEGAVPKGYHNVQPYLTVEDAEAAIDFYIAAFGAKERVRMHGPNGRIMHAELELGDSCVMLSEENLAMQAMSPKHYGGSPVTIMLYIPDVDHTYARAVDAGAQTLREPADQFYGDRSAGVVDPFGHKWYLATHVRDVSPEEMRQALESMAGAQQG